MGAHSVTATLQIRHASIYDWTSRNPVLAQGEYGLDTTNYLLKIGDGVTDWAHLPYLNKLDTTYFQMEEDGTIGEIGGIEHKLLGAEDANVDIFLVPSGKNYQDALTYHKSKKMNMKLIEVKTIQDAVSKLEKEKGK